MPASARQFQGFEPLSSNYVYCPNQFFDVCMPNCSRGAVRIVAFVLRQTLGWLDDHGNPIQQEVSVTYDELITKAGVSRGGIATAVQEAINGRFIRCCSEGRKKQLGQSSRSAGYALRWSRSPRYTRSPEQFDGFFRGEGNRTPIPNSFFDTVVPTETQAIVKVVGTVLRHTIGYQNQFGGRRSSTPLSYSQIQQYANLRDRSSISEAIRVAERKGYIRLIEAGTYSLNPQKQRAGVYGIRWLEKAASDHNSSKNRPEGERFKNQTTNSSEFRPEDRFKKPTTKKTKRKETDKQQSVAVGQAIKLLTQQGLDVATAKKLATQHGLAVIQRQVDWIDYRRPRDRLGMLVKAITDDWRMPPEAGIRMKQQERHEREQREAAREHQEAERIRSVKEARSERKRRLTIEWETASDDEKRQWIAEAARVQSSRMIAEIIRRQDTNAAEPDMNILNTIADLKSLPRVTEPNDSLLVPQSGT